MVTLSRMLHALVNTPKHQLSMFGLIAQRFTSGQVASVNSPARWCPICGAQLLGKHLTCSGACRSRKFRLNHKRTLEPVPVQLNLAGVNGSLLPIAGKQQKEKQ